MIVELRLCALDGCDNSVEVTRTEDRRYCCVAHRKMARNQRRAIVSPPPLRPAELVGANRGATASRLPAPGAAATRDAAPAPRTAQPERSWPPPRPGPGERDRPSGTPRVPAEFGAVRGSGPMDPHEQRRGGLRAAAGVGFGNARRCTAAGFGNARRRTAAGLSAVANVVPLSIREAWAAALGSLASNRLRSFLTTIGIIAGVASVIMLVAMGDGMTKGFDDQWSRFATQITISPITGPVATSKAPQKLTDADLKALKNPKTTPHVATWSPAVSSNQVTVASGQKKAGSQLYGISQNYLELANRHMVAGDWFSQRQMAEADRDAVIGLQVVNDLFGSDADPTTLVGLPIRVGHNTFEIQGVVNSDGQNDNIVMVPLETARAFVVGNDGDKLNVIIAKSTDRTTLEQAKAEIFQVLYAQHHVRESTDRDFNVTDFTGILEQQRQSIKFMSMFIVAIAAISLFVGGVGVANIMLVSVTERTREIGIRKAIGAPRVAIMRQFLTEAVLLTAMGGAVGVVLGIGMCTVGEWVIPQVWPPDPASMTPTPLPLLSLPPVLVAFGVSLVIGLLAGGYPAYRASRMRPIEALRHE